MILQLRSYNLCTLNSVTEKLVPVSPPTRPTYVMCVCLTYCVGMLAPWQVYLMNETKANEFLELPMHEGCYWEKASQLCESCLKCWGWKGTVTKGRCPHCCSSSSGCLCVPSALIFRACLMRGLSKLRDRKVLRTFDLIQGPQIWSGNASTTRFCIKRGLLADFACLVLVRILRVCVLL